MQINNSTGRWVLLQTIEKCSSSSYSSCEGSTTPISRYLQGAIDLALSPDQKSLYVAVYTDRRLVAYSRDTSNGALSYLVSYPDASILSPSATTTVGYRFYTSVVVSLDGNNVYAGAITTSSRAALIAGLTGGMIFMFDRSDAGRITLTGVPSSSIAYYGWDTVKEVASSVFDKIENPIDSLLAGTGLNRLKLPRCLLMDHSDKYVFVASYGNSKIIAYQRDVYKSSGVLIYKTSAENLDQILADTGAAKYPLKYPLNMVISGDGT